MAKMTEREFYKAVMAIEGVGEDIKAFADEGIAKLDARNAKRKTTETKAQAENRVLMDSIVEMLAEKPMVASDIGKALGVSTQKASSLCVLLEKQGRVLVADIKVKGKGTVKQYTLATVVAE